MSTPDLLRELLTAPGPSGHEEEASRVWREAASSFEDNMTMTQAARCSSASRRLIQATASTPFITGISMSMRTMSGQSRATDSIAAWPLTAASTVNGGLGR